MQALRPGSLLVVQEDVHDAQTGEVLIKKGAHLMYLDTVSSRLRDFGHRVVDATTLKKYILDAGVEIVDADEKGTMFVVRPRYPDLPIHARRLTMDGVVRT